MHNIIMFTIFIACESCDALCIKHKVTDNATILYNVVFCNYVTRVNASKVSLPKN